MGSKSKAPPKPIDPLARTPIRNKRGKITGYGPSVAEKQSQGLVNYYGTAVPQFMQLQERLGPQLMAQMFSQTGQFLGGVGGQPGFQDLLRTTSQEAGRTIGDLRAAELGQMTGQAGLTRGLMQALSPEQARSVELQRQAAERAQGLESEFQATSQPYTGMFGTMAQEAFARRGTLSPEEQRASQQLARESATAAGRLGGNAAIASEIQNREAAKAARRQEAASTAGLAQQQMMQTEAQRAALRGEAQAAGQGLYGLAQGFYTQPGLNLLSQAPLSYQAGQQTLGTAMAAGPAASGQFDYNMPLGLGQQQASAMNQYNLEKFKADQQNRASKMGMIGSVAGLALAPFTGGLSAGLGLGGMAGGLGSALGSGGFNLGASMFNAGAGMFGAPLKAKIV